MIQEKYDIAPLIAELQSPVAYPHPVQDIHVVQTHTSCVFLTGEYAYKIKKPVDFGFLDYSTLERRRVFCEQELRLNRRLCSDVYLDLVPIIRHQGQLQVGPPPPNAHDEIIEWAVRMRQMRESDMLPSRLRDGSMSRPLIEQLGHLLARFHAGAHTDDSVRAYGSPEAIASTIAFTLRTMQQVTQDTPQAETYHALQTYFECFQRERVALFQKRLHTNRIRDCHGDLRAQNICLDPRFGEGIQIFDCIEFNPSLRYIDTAADIAYLAMDLDLSGHSEMRASLMEIYCKEAGDDAIAEILPFYLAYRAMVRGNIALLAAGEREMPLAEREAQRALALTAYDLAWSYTHLPARPTLLITVGYSGSGKSTLAQALCRRLPAIHLSSDQLRKERAGVALESVLQATQYTVERREEIYDLLRQRATSWLAQGARVLLDATFLDPVQRQRTQDFAEAHDADLWVIDCRCPEEEIRRRLMARHTDPNGSDADLDIYLHQRQRYDSSLPTPWEFMPPAHYIRAEMTSPIEELAHQIVFTLAGG